MKQPIHILLVEDNEGDVELIERAFQDGGPPCHISIVNNGMEAMDFLYKRGEYVHAPTPRLILLDLNMPRMDGKKFLETVKVDTRLRTIPVVMLTSSQSPSDIRDCYERQASCYVVKPFNGKEFADTVRLVINFWTILGQLPQMEAA